MQSETFITSYQKALASQDWNFVSPLIDDKACVSFSNGKVHKGKKEVEAAFKTNFSTIKGESYKMKNIHWVKREAQYAVYLFEYYWSGYINDKLVEGNGIGTSMIIKKAEKWVLLSEHLGKK